MVNHTLIYECAIDYFMIYNAIETMSAVSPILTIPGAVGPHGLCCIQHQVGGSGMSIWDKGAFVPYAHKIPVYPTSQIADEKARIIMKN